MEERPLTLGIRVDAGPDADAEEVAETTLRLRHELLDLDVERVEPPPGGEPPPGTRGVELSGVSSKEQRRLTDEWLRRHTGR